jgi:hypothetical protein
MASMVAADIRTNALATAVLLVTGLSPTSTIRDRPCSSAWVSEVAAGPSFVSGFLFFSAI